MKNILFNTLLSVIIFLVNVACAQESPPVTVTKNIKGIDISISYFSPKVKERIIWGGLVDFDKVWRTGANNATTIQVSQEAKIGKNKLPAGRYALFTIPKKGDTWTVIINKEADQWGAYNYKESEDLLRFDVKVDRTIDINESLVFDIDDDGNVVFAWEYKTFKFKIDK